MEGRERRVTIGYWHATDVQNTLEGDVYIHGWAQQSPRKEPEDGDEGGKAEKAKES